MIMQWDMVFPFRVGFAYDVETQFGGGGAVVKMRGSFRNVGLLGVGFAIGGNKEVSSNLVEILGLQKDGESKRQVN